MTLFRGIANDYAKPPPTWPGHPLPGTFLCRTRGELGRENLPFDMALRPLSRIPNEKSRIFPVATVNYPAAGSCQNSQEEGQ